MEKTDNETNRVKILARIAALNLDVTTAKVFVPKLKPEHLGAILALDDAEFIANVDSTGRRTLNISPKILRDLQGLKWTVEFLSGRGKGKRKGLAFNPKAPNLAIRTLALALFDAKGKFNESRWHKMVKSGAISEFRQRRDGSIISFVFQNRRIRHSTLNEFRKGLDMTTIINPAGGLPDALTELLHASGYTSADVQEVLADIRDAQGHVSAASKTVENNNPSMSSMEVV